jgi:NTP pyrophosphatase (non-canonical NTP hydrolase)
MENPMDFNYYQTNTHRTAKYPINRALDYLVLGLASEAGEVAGKYKKIIRDNNGRLDPNLNQQIIDELGDVLWYVSEIATTLNFNLSAVARRNLDKLADRQARDAIGGSGDNR